MYSEKLLKGKKAKFIKYMQSKKLLNGQKAKAIKYNRKGIMF